MPTLVSRLTAKKDVRVVDIGLFVASFSITVPAGAANGDSIQVAEIPCGLRLLASHLAHPATIGAAATAKLQKNALNSGTRTDLTIATTAGGASFVSGAATTAPQDLATLDVIEILIGGGAPTAGQTLNVDLVLARK